jgi:hypothetical protein
MMTTKKVETDAEGKLTGRVLFLFDDHVVAKAATDKEPAVEGKDSFEVFDLKQVPGAEALDPNVMAGRLAIHGASQKIGDSYAGVAKESDPLAMAKANVKDTIAQIYAGTWRVNAGGGPRVNDLAVAMARVTGEPLEGDDGTIAFVAAMSDDDKKAMRKKPKIAAALAAIAAEKAAERAKKLAEAAEKEEATA